MIVGIDLGGTKIEACLFDDDLMPLVRRRIATPIASFDDMIDGLVDQYHWACAQAGTQDLKLGIGVPGFVEKGTGRLLATNLPGTDKSLPQVLEQRLNAAIATENDCKCFALSEANGGAGDGAETVFGLILGTGCGGGVCLNGRLVRGLAGLPGEIGHLGIPVSFAERLPVLICKCGRVGCYETLVSGPGLRILGQSIAGLDIPAEEIAARAAAGEPRPAAALALWSELVCELLLTIQASIDPDQIVLGGGLSKIPDITSILDSQMQKTLMQGLPLPQLSVARFGDASGVRGAAMLHALNLTSATRKI
ncbi:MAG: glucokinase family protein [Cypionkella sp.]|uniref:ROK family protein n=1 Tax=Cypionkella sp. TaxID=2811411 RepID=UPI0026058E35|nr:ROK family protein [Cypionkella sp.]MDB5659427.1 glucokinase family protein [Cypionkella sp.]